MCAIFPPLLLLLLLCPERTIQTQRQKPRDPQKDRPTDTEIEAKRQKETDRQTDRHESREIWNLLENRREYYSVCAGWSLRELIDERSW
jgi:hypothetical protein